MAPSWAQVLVMAAPMPFAPPVTSTTLSLSCRSMFCGLLMCPSTSSRPVAKRDTSGNHRALAAQIQETSVNRIVRTRDERRFVRAKIKSKGSDLLGLSHSPDRLRFFQLLEHLLLSAGIVAMQKTIDKRSMDSCRRDAIAANVVGKVIPGHRICHRYDRALTHGIAKTIGQRRRPHTGRY